MSNKANDILTSWQANSGSWIETIDQAAIESRKLATNQAIINAVKAANPQRVLDVGCGEGWLCRALHSAKIKLSGIDGVKALIENAEAKGGGPAYYTGSYQQIRAGAIELPGQFDVMVFNFALFEDTTATFTLLKVLRNKLEMGGRLIIQTVGFSPEQASAWHTEDWQMLARDFPTAFSWYYRNLQEWKDNFDQNDWLIEGHQEVLHPLNEKLLSWIFVLSAR